MSEIDEESLPSRGQVKLGPGGGQVGAKFGPTWGQVVPSWGQIGAKLGPSWAKLGLCWQIFAGSWQSQRKVALHVAENHQR